MGFYGNITNMARTSFTFDKTYPNRYAMDQAATEDEVFIGRYVLVDYDLENDDQSVFIKSYKWIDEDTGNICFGQSFPSSSPTGAYRWNTLNIDDVVVVPYDGDYNQADIDATTNEYWICTGVDENGYNTFEVITVSDNSYTQNYNIDTTEYGNGRGYDSTAWQKVTSNGVTKYVMVAELNSVVPSFGITADAPTMTPLRPHWGKDSTNVYYDLHWQVPWGVRIKSAKADLQVPTLDDYGVASSDYIASSADTKEYPSDEVVVWTKQEGNPENSSYNTRYASYDASNNKITWNSSDNVVGQPAAIYYNKAGFNPEISVYSSDKKYEGWGREGLVEDKISFEPTGHSGYGYNGHDVTDTDKQYDQPDSMELSVMLPSLGDAVAHMWDLVYGDREANNNNATNSRNMTVGWENARYEVARDGLRLIPNNTNAYRTPEGLNPHYRADQVSTIAGAINSVHDLMGMIITPEDSIDTLVNNVDSLDYNRIYYAADVDDFYRKKLGYSYVDVDTAWTNGDDFFNDKDEYGNNKGHEGSVYGYELMSDITADNFDPLMCYELVEGQYVPVDSNATFDENKDYYGRYIVAPAEPYQPLENAITWEPDKYWYEDYIGSSYYADSEFKQDFIQSYTYEYGKTYYKDLVVEDAGDLSPEVYEPGKYWYWNDIMSAYQLDFSDEAVAGRQYYNLDEDYVVPVTGADGIYVPGVYYQETSPGSYRLCNEESPSNYGQFYMAVSNAETIDNKIYIRTYIYERVASETARDNYRPGFYYILANEEDKGSSIIDTEAYRLDESNFVKDPETKETGEGEIVDNTYDSNQIYFVLNETLTRTEDLSKIIDTEHPLRLIPYTTGAFFRHSFINGVESYRPVARAEIKAGAAGLANLVAFWTTTSHNNKNTDARSDIMSPVNSRFDWYRNLVYTGLVTDIYSYPDYALKTQRDFFTRGLYHKKVRNDFAADYSNPAQVNGYHYLFDATPNQDTGASYVIVKSGTKLENVSFYYPYHFYEKVGDNYHLLTSTTVPEDGSGNPITIYEKYSYYVDSDTAGIHQHGEEWNPNIKYIPSTITLAVRHEYNILEGIEGFARDFTTIHGMLLRLLQTLEFNDSETRDTRTMRGMLNSLNDVLTKIHDLTPGDAVYVNDYGQISSAPVETDNWIDVEVNSRVKDPSIVIKHHDVMSEAATTSSSDVNGNGDTIELYTPNVDAKGHVVGHDVETVTLPYGYKTVTVGDVDVVADNTQDDIEVVAGDAWVELAGSANAHTITATHANAQATAASIDVNSGNVTPAFGGTFNIPTFGFDAKGHYKESASTTVTIPTPSLVQGTGNVVTGLALAANTGTLTETKANVGDVALGSYTSQSSTPEILATDTVGAAISKLEKGLEDEVDARSRAVTDEVTNRTNAISDAIAALDMPSTVSVGTGEIIDSISETDGIVSATTRALAAADIPDITISQVTDLQTELDNLSAKFDNYQPAGEYLTSASKAGEYQSTSTDPITGDETQITVDVSYGELYNLITTLSNRIVALEARVDALENPTPESQTEP